MFRSRSQRTAAAAAASLFLITACGSPGQAQEAAKTEQGSIVHGGVYLDLAYLASNNRPANHTWRSKGTSSSLDKPEIDNVTVFLERDASGESRWGFEVGLQWGIDPDSGIPSSNAVGDAETLVNLYYTNATYVFGIGRGLDVTGGLIPGHLGYEDFHAIHNPTYTRIYGVDYVPYFEFGLEATYPFSETLAASFLVVNGYDYLASPNDVPSYGAQLVADATSDFELKANVYYGPEQSETSLDYWRFVGESIGEWQQGDFLLAWSAGYGSERQATVPGTPRFEWAWGAAWFQWLAKDPWRFAVRPEFFWDPDGLMTGFEQTIRAVTVAAEFRVSRAKDVRLLSARLEYRYDRSTGAGGGFFEGSSNGLVPDQHLLIASLLWRFDSANRGPVQWVPGG